MPNTKNKESTAYKNKLNYIKSYSKSKYRKIIILLDPIKDKDLLEDMDGYSSKPNFIRMLYENYKRS